MKKLTALILALCVILSAFALGACSKKTDDGKKDPTQATAGNQGGSNDKTEESLYKTVSDAIAKTKQVKSCEVTMGAQIKTDLMGTKSEVTDTSTGKFAGLDTAKPTASIESTTTMLGETYGTKSYFDGEWNYVEMEDSKYKSQMSFEEFGNPVDSLIELPETLFTGASSTKNADGSITVILNVDEATIENLYEELIVGMVYNVAGDNLEVVTTKDATIKVSVADGYISEFDVAFTCEYVAGSDKIVYEATQTLDMSNWDKAVTVTAPADLDQYYELDWG